MCPRLVHVAVSRVRARATCSLAAPPLPAAALSCRDTDAASCFLSRMTVTVLEEIAEAPPGPLPKCGDKVVVHYTGWLAMKPPPEPPFDSSREKGHAFTFTVGVGKVIPGWDEAMLTMTKGTRRKVLISSDAAYGPRGRQPVIPANADLIFDIEVLNINETLVEEGMRVRREEAERVERFLKLQDEARAAEALQQGPKRPAEDSDDSDSSSSSSESEETRRRRKERKERKRKEKKEKKKKHKKERKEGKSSKRDKEDKHEKHEKHKHKKRRDS